MTNRPERSKRRREIDLHRLTGEQARRLAARELHTARVRGEEGLILITGRGFGNAAQEPILRGHMESWLASAEARRLGVLSWQRVSRGGALEVLLGAP